MALKVTVSTMPLLFTLSAPEKNYTKVDYPLQLVGAEARLARLEQCDCQKSCFINGTALPDGSTWEKDCNHCTCKVRNYNTLLQCTCLD